MTKGKRRKKKQRRMEREEKQVRLAVISRISVCDTMGTKANNHPKATFLVEPKCLLMGLAALCVTEHFNFTY